MNSFLLLLICLVQGSFGYRVVCVYTNWSQYRPEGGKFLPEDVDPSLCTHLIYVYAKLKGNRLEPAEWNDEGSAWSEGMYERVNNLKQINPELKTLLGVGGWMMGSKDFSKLAGSRISRRIFAKTTAKFLRGRNFDGLTIDWQHPTKRGGKPQDKVNFSMLLKEIRQAFEAESKKSGLPPLILTAGVSASREIIGDAYEIDNITKYTDFMNVMAYDLHGAWDNYTGHPSQLYAREEEFGPSTEINVDAAMRHWMSIVPDRSKLNLGISTYGRTFTLRKSRHNDYGVPTTGPGVAGDFTQQPGMLAYYERCFQYADAPRVWDVASQVAYWYTGDQWIAGEDVESVKAKVNWTRTYEIGGMMIWSLDTDDFTDKCQTQAYPLLNTVATDINDPAFIKANISVVQLSGKAKPKFTIETRKISEQNSLDSKLLEEINLMSTTTATNRMVSNIQQPSATISTAANKKKNISFAKKESFRQVNGKQNKQQQQQQQQKQQRPQNNMTKQRKRSQMQKEHKLLPQVAIRKETPQVKQVRKVKQRRRLNPQLRRKVLLRKHNSNRKKLKKTMQKKPARKMNKTPTKRVILNTKAISSNHISTPEPKLASVAEHGLVTETEATTNSTKNQNENIDSGSSVTKLIVQHNPGIKQEKEQATRLKSQSTDNKKTLSVTNNVQIKSSPAEHIIVHDRHKDISQSVKGNKNKKTVLTKVGKTVRIASKRKQAPIRILRRKSKTVEKSTRTNEKGKNKSSQRRTAILKTIKQSSVPDSLNRNELTSNTVTKQNGASVSVSITKSVILKQTTPALYSTTLSTSTPSSRPVQSKQFQKPVNKKVRWRKKKVLKRGKRLKRRRMKRPKVSPNAAKPSV